jgi:L-ascorbate metabolism protein UlaG (beta-lactamase superfamily)
MDSAGTSSRDRIKRRWWLAGAGTAGALGLAATAYNAFPAFWHRYAEDMKRDIHPPPRRPAWETWPDKGIYGAWLGHATVLLKIDGFTLITDPVFSDKVGIDLGLMTLGLKRLVAPALDPPPKVDLIVLSHAHFDHFDTPTLRRMESKGTAVVTASGTSDLLRANKYGSVKELRWGDRAQAGEAKVRAFEVNHWGARMRTDNWRGYNGYLIDIGSRRILFGGDTAMTSAFRTLRGERRPDLAIMPIGAYNPWIRYHCTPEQAVEMARDAGADRYVPIHHQTFQLSSEPYTEPIERFQTAVRDDAAVLVRKIGDEFNAG